MSKFRFPRLTLIFVGLIALLLIVVPVRATAGPGIAETDDDEILGGPWGRWGGPDTPDWVVADGVRNQCQEKQEYGATKCWQKYTFGYSRGQNLMPPVIVDMTRRQAECEVGCLMGFNGRAMDYDGRVESITFSGYGTETQRVDDPQAITEQFVFVAQYNHPGRYIGVITAVDNDGLIGSESVESVVTDHNGALEGLPTIATQEIFHMSGDPPLTVQVNATGFDSDGSIKEWRLSYGDGTVDDIRAGTHSVSTSHVYDKPGTYYLTITLVDNDDKVYSAVHKITVTSTNSLPVGSQSAGLPGMVMEWTHPGGEVQRWFLPLDSNGTTDEGIFWTTALGSSYSVTTVKFDWVIPESLQASLADGDHRWTTWLVDSEGKKSNKRYFYYTVGAGATAAAVKPAAGELTFNLLASTYANESLTPQYGTVEVYANGALAETKDITFGQVSLTVTPGIDAQWIFKIIDNDPRTVRLNWVNGQLKIYYDAAGETPVDYYQAEDGSYYLEYWAPNLYICGPHDDYGPIIGRWWVRRD